MQTLLYVRYVRRLFTLYLAYCDKMSRAPTPSRNLLECVNLPMQLPRDISLSRATYGVSVNIERQCTPPQFTGTVNAAAACWSAGQPSHLWPVA